MTFKVYRRSVSVWRLTTLVSVLTAVYAPSAFAQSVMDKTLPPVVVTASRFPSTETTPIGATVITAQQIREAGINNVNEAVRKIGGVFGRQSFYGTQDYQLDLRGFGTTSDYNMVVLVDGIRLSENEQATALMSSVPIELVERVEIIRGGSSVLYGEGATGGIVHIITKRAPVNGTRGSVVAEVGSFDHRDFRASVAKGWDGFSLDANVGRLRTDNYRDNNEAEQDNFSGGAQWTFNDGRFGVRIDALKQENRFAGDLTLEQFRADPRQTISPDDFGSTDMERYTVFAEKRIGSLELASEISHREKDVKTRLFGFDSEYDSRVTQFSPRLRYSNEINGNPNELIVGMDFSRWDRKTNSSFSAADASQDSHAIYVRDEIKLDRLRLAAGARTEKFKKDFEDTRASFGSTGYKTSKTLNAWDVQLNYDFANYFSVFGKAGRSYRVANADDNASTVNFNEALEPQTSRDLELGAKAGDARLNATIRVFRHKLKNEIFFDPTVFANSNLDPTKRQGIEIEAQARLAEAFSLSGVLQHVSAKFTDGPNDGHEMVLVPKNIATLRLNWMPGNGHSVDVGVQWVDSQRYGNDFDNSSCSSRIPSYATVDGRYALRTGPWEFAIAGSNLTDKDYYSNAFACRAGIYPESGRQIKLSVRYDF